LKNVEFTREVDGRNCDTDHGGLVVSPKIAVATIVLRMARMSTPADAAYGQDIRNRAFEFACQIIWYCDDLMKRGGVGRILAPQLLRCGTSIGANLEEARGGESRRDFISKCSIALKESRESLFRLRIAERCQLGATGKATALVGEAAELAAIIGAIVRNARRNLAK
jgi:four helix bundle protein